mgnify:FL=1
MEAQIERVSSGIPGLDDILGGGFPRPSAILLAGHPGTGKTTLTGQVAYYRASQFREKVLFITLSEPSDRIKLHFKMMGMDFEPLEKEGTVDFAELMPLTGSTEYVRQALEGIIAKVESTEPKVLVVDSISAMLQFLPPEQVRPLVLMLVKLTHNLGILTFFIAELPMLGIVRLAGVEEFISDGVIILRHEETREGLSTRINVVKLRLSRHSREYYGVAITDTGFEVLGPMRLEG